MGAVASKSNPGELVHSDGGPVGHFLQPTWGDQPWGGGSLLDRFNVVRSLIDEGSVLDVGCASRYGRPDWIHGLLHDEVEDLVGIDTDETMVREISSHGFDVRAADAQDFDLGRRFHTVFAGEVIDHLDNVHDFLACARRHLWNDRGRLVLTTPNVFYCGNFVYRWGGHSQVHPEHVGWFCEDTLRRVLQVNGFSRITIMFTGHRSPVPARRAASFLAQRLLPPRLALDTLVAVAYMD